VEGIAWGGWRRRSLHVFLLVKIRVRGRCFVMDGDGRYTMIIIITTTTTHGDADRDVPSVERSGAAQW
jgi:hypothetical protein